MKNLQEAYAEVMASEALKAKFAEVKTQEDLFAFVRGLGVEATAEEVLAFLQGKASAEGELNDEALLQVAGGKSVNRNEVAFSIISLGIGCAASVAVSKARGLAGSELKEGMICNHISGSD